MIVKRIFYSIVVFCLAANSLLAQNSQEAVSETDTTFSKSFFNNFYVKAEVGAQALFSADADLLDSKDRLTPSYAIELGKWLCPVFGVALKAQGGILNGFSTAEDRYIGPGAYDPVRDEVTINPDGSYRHFVRYGNLSFNLYFNVGNMFGYKNNAFFELIPSLGIGAMHVFDYKGIPAKDNLSATCGLEGSFRIAPKLRLNVGANAVFFDNEFESRLAGDRDYENYVSANLGLVYFFRHKGFVRSKTDVKK